MRSCFILSTCKDATHTYTQRANPLTHVSNHSVHELASANVRSSSHVHVHTPPQPHVSCPSCFSRASAALGASGVSVIEGGCSRYTR